VARKIDDLHEFAMPDAEVSPVYDHSLWEILAQKMARIRRIERWPSARYAERKPAIEETWNLLGVTCQLIGETWYFRHTPPVGKPRRIYDWARDALAV
jgi:hypothetical protein